MDASTLRTPISVAELVAEYVRQTLDDVSSLAQDMGDRAAVQAGLLTASSTTMTTLSTADAADGEENAYLVEVQSLRERISRLVRVVQCLRQWQQRHEQTARAFSSSIPPAEIATKSDGYHGVNVPDGGRARAPLVRRAVAALAECSGRMGVSGIKALNTPAPSSAACTVGSAQPPGTPVSFPETTLNLYGRNVHVVFRRPKPSAARTSTAHPQSGKRDREDVGDEDRSCASAPHRTSVQIVSTAQKKARWQLYTCRDALLPRVDQLASGVAVQGPPLSPALRHFNQLNAAAEAAMLSGAWKISTKAQLLQELPRLYEEVTTQLHEDLRTALFGDRPGDRAPLSGETNKDGGGPSNPERAFVPPRYFRIDACNAGVVRLVVQEALYADLTYDLVRKTWSVCRLQWNIWTSAAAATLMNGPHHTHHQHHPNDNSAGPGELTAIAEPPLAVVVAGDDTASRADLSDHSAEIPSRGGGPRLVVPADRPVFLDSLLSVGAPSPPSKEAVAAPTTSSTWHAQSPALRSFLLHHTTEMHNFVQKQFAEHGFCAGCLSLNQLVCAVTMDVLIRQLNALRTQFFVGPLQSSFALDVRAGTFVAFHVLTPPVVLADAPSSSPTPRVPSGAPLKPLHVRCDLAGGTIVVDQVWGTDVEHRRRTLLLHPTACHATEESAARPVVVDAEALLWRSYCC